MNGQYLFDAEFRIGASERSVKRYNTAFTLPLLIFGILAGANAAYKILSTYIEASKKENDRQVSRLLKKDNIDKEEKVHIPKMKSRIYKDY